MLSYSSGSLHSHNILEKQSLANFINSSVNNSRHSNHLLTINYRINKKSMECVGKRIDYCPLNRQLSMSVSVMY